MLTSKTWLFFDIGSTLVDESLVYSDRFNKIARSANVSCNYVTETALNFYKENKQGDAETAKLLNVSKPSWCSELEHLYEDAEMCLKKLSTHYKIGIIANQAPGTKQRLETFGILKYIDLIVASAEEGIAKPDKRIFELALHKANCRSDQAVMIGDRIDNDVIPAKKLGMTTIWIKQGFGQYWKFQTPAEHPDYEVSSLSELLDLFFC